jgi:hypothetical protein
MRLTKTITLWLDKGFNYNLRQAWRMAGYIVQRQRGWQ